MVVSSTPDLRMLLLFLLDSTIFFRLVMRDLVPPRDKCGTCGKSWNKSVPSCDVTNRIFMNGEEEDICRALSRVEEESSPFLQPHISLVAVFGKV